MNKSFSLAAVLNVTTGRMLTEMDDIYKLLGHMTGDSPFTHQLPRFADECKPVLYEMFPELVQVEAKCDRLDKLINSMNSGEAAVKTWLRELSKLPELKESYDVPANCVNRHASVNPIVEMAAMLKGG